MTTSGATVLPRLEPHRASLPGAVALLLLLASGCAASGSRPTRRPDVTCGLTLEMFVESEGSAFERYRVERDGVLQFGGGFDARLKTFTWSGPLTPEEIDRLLDAIRENRWFEVEPPSVAEPRGRLFRIDVHDRGRRASFIVRGDSPAVVPAYEILRLAARRRNDAFLDSLPKAGRQKN